MNNTTLTNSDTVFSLSDYLDTVKLVVNTTFEESVWVRAEVRSLTGKGGHYYFELAQKGDDGTVIASCRATLWRYRASTVLQKFQLGTGKALTSGVTVLVKGSATFHSQYGFSFNIIDIDPNYTLGALVQAYHTMSKRLADEGLTTLNKALPAPFDIRHVIVIAPQNAAGLGDFRSQADRLAQTGACQFHYHHATFQGNHAPQEIREAIGYAMQDFVSTQQTHPDLLVIIRGGGAVGDLAYLNDYELACFVAEQPVPVWVGIGHERDRVILDEVAHTCFDTPSKVIAGIENQLLHIVALAKDAIQRIRQVSQLRLSLAKKDSNFELHRLKNTAHTYLNRQKAQLNSHLSTLKSLSPRLTLLANDCRHLQQIILLQHPKRTLNKGYALVRHHNTVISSVKQLDGKQHISIEFADGVVSASVHQT